MTPINGLVENYQRGREERRARTAAAAREVSGFVERLKAKATEMPSREPTCQLCDGTKWKTIKVDGVSRVTRCDCVVVVDPVPPTLPLEFKDALFSTYEKLPGNEAAIRAATQFLKAERGDLYLHGDVGTGKSRLAASILHEYYRTHHTGVFFRVPRLLHDMQPSTTSEELRAELDRALKTVPLIVLDDIGAERDIATDFTRRTLYEIYEDRWDAGLRTIWTSNLSIQKLSDFLDDERLVSRIHHRSDIVVLTTQDQRVARRRRW